VYDERVLELMDIAQESMTTESDINKTAQIISDIDNCIERAREKVNEIVDIQGVLQPLHADGDNSVSYKN
jgi:hypothetical protein